MSSKNQPRPTNAERTALARQKAKTIRDAQLKKEKRNSWLIRGGVLAAAVAIVVVIALIVIQTNKANEPIASNGPVPANTNVYGGIEFGKDGVLIPPTTAETTVDTAKLPAQPTAAATKASGLDEIGIKATAAGKPAQAVIYLDFMCPACNNFEKQYSDQLTKWQNDGTITLEYRPLNFLDRFSSGTNYSSRAAAAAACVADTSPDKYKTFFDSLFANQPAENGKGLDNATLVKLATEAGAADISSCVNDKTFRPYVANTSGLASAHGVNATPTVFIDGQQWQDGALPDFVNGIVAAKK